MTTGAKVTIIILSVIVVAGASYEAYRYFKKA